MGTSSLRFDHIKEIPTQLEPKPLEYFILQSPVIPTTDPFSFHAAQSFSDPFVQKHKRFGEIQQLFRMKNKTRAERRRIIPSKIQKFNELFAAVA